MVAYAVTDWVSADGSLEAVTALLEIQIETLDTTTDPILHVNVFQMPNGLFKAVLVTNNAAL